MKPLTFSRMAHNINTITLLAYAQFFEISDRQKLVISIRSSVFVSYPSRAYLYLASKYRIKRMQPSTYVSRSRINVVMNTVLSIGIPN